MSVELSLIKCFCDSRDVHDKYYPYIETLQNMDRDIRILMQLVHGYYEKYESVSIGKDDLKSFYDYQHPAQRGAVLHKSMIESIYELNVNPHVAEDHLEKMMERHYASSILTDLQGVIEGNKWNVLPDIKEKIEDYISKLKYPPASALALVPQRLTIEELIKIEIDPFGYTWPLQKLNEAIGVVRKGKFGLGYAYVDSGKSSFGNRCVSHWLPQLDEDEFLVYAGNEEGFAANELRVTQSLLDWTSEQIQRNPQEAERLRYERGLDRLLTFDSIYHVDNIQKLLEQYRPAILVIDQVTKLRSKGRVTQDIEALTYVANFCREKAKEFNCAIFGLAQAVGDAYNKMWLELTDLYNSRVGIQGELDYAIGIGKSNKPEESNRRFFHVTKNKFGEHLRFATIFESENNKWIEI